MSISNSRMQETPIIPMERPYKLIRKSIHTFLQHYHYFTLIAALLAFPFAASILMSQAFAPSSSLLFIIHARLIVLSNAAGFPPSSEFFALLNLKLSQTISASIFSIPFTFLSLLLAKACIIEFLNQQKPSSQPSFSSILNLYSPLFVTYIFNTFVIISSHATAFCLLIIGSSVIEELGCDSPSCIAFFSTLAAIVYSIFIANALMVCNLALISAGVEKCGGFMAILNACVMIRGRTSAALLIALPVNLVLAAVEALFQYRVVRNYYVLENVDSAMVMEGMFIAYLYANFVVFDTIASFIFYKSCKTSCLSEYNCGYYCSVDIVEENGSKKFQDFGTTTSMNLVS